MGDDELNFTEEEARGWEHDPRNQIQDWTACEQALAFSAVLVIAALILIWLASIPVQQPAAPGQVPAAGEAGPARVWTPPAAASVRVPPVANPTLPCARAAATRVPDAGRTAEPRAFETVSRPRSAPRAAARSV